MSKQTETITASDIECDECKMIGQELKRYRRIIEAQDIELAELRLQLSYHRQWYSAMRGLIDIAETQIGNGNPSDPGGQR